jgi:hypothetical protein
LEDGNRWNREKASVSRSLAVEQCGGVT